MEPRRLKVGLALGGGVARGLSHIGVLRVLQEAHIEIDFVAGASAGAIIGAVYCAGAPVEQIHALAKKLHWWQLARPVWPARGLLSLNRLSSWLRAEIGDLSFEQLTLPFATSTVDLLTGKPVMLRTGQVARAVQASCSVPGLFVPTEMDGMLLADGNFGDAVPVQVLREMGADYVIGVDIMQPALRRKLGFIGFGLAGLEILLQRAGNGVALADCMIEPALSGKTYVRLSQMERLVELGEAAARARLPGIQAALAGGLDLVAYPALAGAPE